MATSEDNGGDDFKTNGLDNVLPAAVMTSKIETNSDVKTEKHQIRVLATYADRTIFVVLQGIF